MKPRSEKVREAAEDTIEIQDFPESPLSGWQHYGILKLAEAEIHAELKRQGYDGHLVGLGLTYTVEKGRRKRYTMSYGYKDEPQDPSDDSSDPLCDQFILELHDFVSKLIAQNINPETGNFYVHMNASLNPVHRTWEIDIWPCTPSDCTRSSCVGQSRKFIRHTGGPWICTHKPG